MTALDAARRVADAVLYEGYLLYPYRASSSKNQVRWQFGVLGPVGAVEAMAGEEPGIFTECLLEPTAEQASIDVYLRFLQTQWRTPERLLDGAVDRYEAVDQLRVGETNWIAWHEAVEQEVVLAGVGVEAMRTGHEFRFDLPGGEDIETLRDADGAVAGRLVRTRYPLAGRVGISVADDRPAGALRIRVEVENVASLDATDEVSRTVRRDLAARQSFVGTHLLLVANDASFASVVDPPAGLEAAAARCSNARCWAFLAGSNDDSAGQRSDIVLGSPIILGDFPAIADESPGQLFDSAEIDEILTLRIMTMTDEEKVAARGTDPRAAAIIDRSDAMPPEVFERLHGALRSFDPPDPRTVDVPDFPSITTTFDAAGNLTSADSAVSWFSEAADAAVTPNADVVMVNGWPVSRDSRVRLRPCRRADAHDMFLAGQVAIVRRIDRDVDGAVHIAVLLEDDPAADLHDWHGRYYYFGTDEIEPLAPADSHGATS